MYDLILKNGTVINGSGEPGFVADIAVVSGSIVQIERKIKTNSEKTMDCTGLVITPGFVDIQNHSDGYWQLLDHPELSSMLLQGFTTIVVGNCGASMAPLINSNGLKAFNESPYASVSNSNWSSFSEFANQLNSRPLGCFVASFVGIRTMLFALIGSVRPLSPNESDQFIHMLELAMKQGAMGLSVGASSTHEWMSLQSILPEALEVIKSYGGTLSIHLRDYDEEVMASLTEVLEIAWTHNVPIKISHLKIQSKHNHHYIKDIFRILENAAQRIPVSFDAYPYNVTYRPLSDYLPTWLQTNWQSSLDDFKTAKWMEDTHEHLGKLIVASTDFPINALGKSIKELAENAGVSTGQTCINILRQGGNTLVFDESLDLSMVWKILSHPLACVASDGAGFPTNTKTNNWIGSKLLHPRSFGSAPKFLQMARESKKMNLPTAISKLTSMPAQAVGLKKAGLIGIGLPANLVIFDHLKVGSSASIVNPQIAPTGIDSVLIRGILAVHKGKLVNTGLGEFLKR